MYDPGVARTNIDIDDEPLRLVMRRYGIRTKTEAVDLALRHLAGRPLTIAETLAMHGARSIEETPPDPSP